MIRARQVVENRGDARDSVTLDYDGRFRRRIALRSDGGEDFLLDLAQTTDLQDGQGLLLEDGRVITVRAADEDLMIVRARDPHHLVRTAWHVGNRHLPCRVGADGLTLRWDHVIAEMLEGLGCTVERARGPFLPEGGAYGMGRTHSHAH